MDSAQIDVAMRGQLPVIYEGRQYERITEYICWYDSKGNRRLSVNLKSGRALYRVPADKVDLAPLVRGTT